MSKGKLVIVISLLLVLLLTLTGCGTLRYSMTVLTAGARRVEWTVNMTGESDADYQKALAFATAIADNRAKSGRPAVLTTEGKTIYITEEYASADDYYIAMGYTGWEDNEVDEYVGKGLMREYRSTASIVSRSVVVSYALAYLNSADLSAMAAFKQFWSDKAFLHPDDQAVVAVANAEDLSSTLAGYLGEEDETADRLYAYTLEGLEAVGYDLDEMLVKYDYQHTYKSVYALDAIEIPSGGGTVYEWETDLAHLADLEITICQKAPSVWAWELIAIAAGVLVIGIIVLVVVVKRRKQNATREEV